MVVVDDASIASDTSHYSDFPVGQLAVKALTMIMNSCLLQIHSSYDPHERCVTCSKHINGFYYRFQQ